MSNKDLLTKELTPEEFTQYYFLKEELKDFCRREGLKRSGNKQDLEVTITNNHEDDPCHKGDEVVWTVVVTNHGPDDAIKGYGELALYPGDYAFKFKVKFQKWLRANPEKTYRDAISAYDRIINSKEKTKIDKQFQYNQYIRDFFSDNNDKSLSEAIKCWNYKKSIKGHNKYERTDLEALL